jgi:hypothetical protein
VAGVVRGPRPGVAGDVSLGVADENLDLAKFPPPPRRPQNRSAFSSDTAHPRRPSSGRPISSRLSHARPNARLNSPKPAAEGESRDRVVGLRPPGVAKPNPASRGRRRLTAHRRALGRSGSRVDADGGRDGKVDHHRVIPDRETGDVAASPGPTPGGSRPRAACDEGGSTMDRAVPDRTLLVVARVARQDEW